MTIELPGVIATFFRADRTADAGAVAECFTPDAVVTDEGKTHTGRDAIRRWMAEASAQYSYTAEPFALAQDGGRTVVTSHLVGNFPGSPVDLRYFFKLDGERIAGLEIVP
jgi:uncharacterized protein (TIGR02246 family)